MNVAERVQTSIRAVNAATRDAVEAGPFTFFRRPSSDHPMLNYAVPVAGAGEWTGIHELREAFAAHGLPPRLEFVGECAPGLEGIVERVYERCGFRRAGTTMVHMVC